MTSEATNPNDQINLRSEMDLGHACQIVRNDLLGEMKDGKWTGELSASALSTATAMSALGLYRKKTLECGNQANPNDERRNMLPDWIDVQLDQSKDWLLLQQNHDGGWGDTNLSYSNISTTLLSIAALNIVGTQDVANAQIKKAWGFVESRGSIAGLRKHYGKDKTFAVPILANCAMAGIVPWREVSPLPFELACVPQNFYRFVQMPVVSYAIPALVAIGQAKFFADPPRNPFSRITRKLSVARSLEVLKRMQPQSGGYLEAIPLTCFVAMSLIHSGRKDHPVVQNALRFIETSFREEGSWPIDTNLATWVTTLSINALCLDGPESSQVNHTNHFLNESCDLDWLLQCQYQSVHPFTGAKPGGWGWSDLSGAVPDADDTPGALIAIRKWYDDPRTKPSQKQKILEAATSGCRWLVDLQNRDDGWPTFCKGWGQLPFDRSGADITAHVLRALNVWQSTLQSGDSKMQTVGRRIPKAKKRGLKFLLTRQNEDGSWYPLWFGNQDHSKEENPIYGTAKIIIALCEILHKKPLFIPSGNLKQLSETKPLIRGLKWLVQIQNSDGGWGGGDSVGWRDLVKNVVASSAHLETDETAEKMGQSSVEETALAVESLLIAKQQLPFLDPSADDWNAEAECNLEDLLNKSVSNGLDWLKTAVYAGFHRQCWPIGFYFAKLWYHEKLYPLIFTAAALTRAVESQTDTKTEHNSPADS